MSKNNLRGITLGIRPIPRIHSLTLIISCQTPPHLFVESPIAKSFWNKFTKCYNATCRGNIALEQNEIIYGVLKHTTSGLTLNHLVIIGKYFLYGNAVQDEKRSQFTGFITLVNEKIELEIEKYIATTTNSIIFRFAQPNRKHYK